MPGIDTHLAQEAHAVLEEIRLDPKISREQARQLVEGILTPVFSELIASVAEAYTSSDMTQKVMESAILRDTIQDEDCILQTDEDLPIDNPASLSYTVSDEYTGWVLRRSPALAELDDPASAHPDELNNAMREYLHELAALRLLRSQNQENPDRLADPAVLAQEKQKLALGTRNQGRELVGAAHVIDEILLRRIHQHPRSRE